MSVRRMWITALVMLAAVAGVAGAQVGRNFERAGIAIQGSGSFYSDLGYISSSSNQYNYWSLTLAPEIDFFFLQDTALYVAPYYTFSAVTTSASNVTRASHFSVDLGVVRYFDMVPSASSGLVPAVGAEVGILAYPGVGDTVSGTDQTDKSLYLYLNAAASVRLYLFISDTIAPYVMVVPGLQYLLSAKDSTGATVNVSSDYKLDATVGVYFGMSYWLPRTKVSLTK